MVEIPEEVADGITVAVLKQHLAYTTEDLTIDLLNATDIELANYATQTQLQQALKIVLAYFGEYDA